MFVLANLGKGQKQVSSAISSVQRCPVSPGVFQELQAQAQACFISLMAITVDRRICCKSGKGSS